MALAPNQRQSLRRLIPWARLSLLGLILLAMALRLYHLDVQSLWYDEGVTAQVARLGAPALARWTAEDIQPPLYYLLVGGWLRLLQPWTGPLAYVLRFVSAVIGVLLVALAMGVGAPAVVGGAGLVAAGLAAISPIMVYYGQEARMYALLVTLVAATALIIVHWAERRTLTSDRLVVAYVALGLAALYTHYFAGFALLALALYWLWRWQQAGRSWRQLGWFTAANAALVAGYLPWLPAMLRRFQVDSSYWSGTLKLNEALAHVAINFTTGATETMLETNALRWLPWFGLVTLLWLLALIFRSPSPPHPLPPSPSHSPSRPRPSLSSSSGPSSQPCSSWPWPTARPNSILAIC